MGVEPILLQGQLVFVWASGPVFIAFGQEVVLQLSEVEEEHGIRHAMGENRKLRRG